MAENERSIRASSLSSYTDCGRRSAAKMFPMAIADAGYHLNPARQNIGAAIGAGAHASLEYTLKQRMDHGGDGTDGEAEEIALDAMRKEAANGVDYDPSTAPNLNTADKQVIRHSRTLRRAIAPKINPVEVEMAFEAEYRGFLITGHIDVREAKSGGDLKTGKFERMNAPQYGAYAMLCATDGHAFERFREFYLPTVALDKAAPEPKIIEYDVRLAEKQALQAIDYAIDDYTAFLQDGNPKHFRANPGSLLCSAKFCQAWGSRFCREHKGAK